MQCNPHTLLKSALVAGIAAALAKIIGFAREIVLAAFYGAGTVSDAFILAFTIPDTLLYFIGASIAASFIPMYHRVHNKTKFTRNIMTCLLLIGLVISAVFTVFPDIIVKLFAFQMEPATFDLAVYFVRYMVWSAVFILLMGIYNAHLEIKGDFFSAGIRSIWRNLAVIFGIILGALSGYNLIIALAPIAGNALCMFLLALSCRKHGYRYRPYLDIHSPELKQMMLLISPMFISTAVIEINEIINRNFAASLSIGAISALNYSGKIQGLFVALIGQSLFIVLFPHMSKLAADGDITKLKHTLIRGIMYIITIMLPLFIGVIILAKPGVRILFQRGSFTADDTIRTASCLRMYALLMISGSINPLIIRAFYAIQNTKIPANTSIVTVFTNVALNFLLIKPLGVEGLALASSLSNILSTLMLLIFLRKKLGHLGLRNNLPEFAKISLSAAIIGAGVWLVANKLPLMSVTVWQSVLLCLLLTIAAFAAHIALLLSFKSQIAFSIIITTMKFFEQKRKIIS